MDVFNDLFLSGYHVVGSHQLRQLPPLLTVKEFLQFICIFLELITPSQVELDLVCLALLILTTIFSSVRELPFLKRRDLLACFLNDVGSLVFAACFQGRSRLLICFGLGCSAEFFFAVVLSCLFVLLGKRLRFEGVVPEFRRVVCLRVVMCFFLVFRLAEEGRALSPGGFSPAVVVLEEGEYASKGEGKLDAGGESGDHVTI